jgi:hypothetical protein
LSDFAAVSDNFGSTLFCGNGCWEIKAYWELDGLGMKKSANPRFGLQVQVLHVRDFRQQEKSRYLSGSIPKQSIAPRYNAGCSSTGKFINTQGSIKMSSNKTVDSQAYLQQQIGA